jgi:hypothetical protein
LTSRQSEIDVPGFASQLLMWCIKGDLTVVVLVDFLQLIVAEVVLQPGILDDHKWLTEAGGVLSTKSAYKSFTNFVEFQTFSGALTKASQRSNFYIFYSYPMQDSQHICLQRGFPLSKKTHSQRVTSPTALSFCNEFHSM